MTTLCRTANCGNPYEPYANDGDGEYATEDFDGLCAACNVVAVNCACCDDRFVPYDPSDPDHTQCPACAAEVVPSGCDHVNSTSGACERY